MAISTDDLARITQQTDVVSTDGDRLGHVHQVYTSDTSGDPAWVTVHTGVFGSQESFVPLSDASFDGDDLRVGVSKDAVHGAPRVDAEGHLSVEEEDDLYRYYGITNPDHSPDEVAAAATGTAGSEGRDDAAGVPAAGSAGRGPDSSDATDVTDATDATDATTVGQGGAAGAPGAGDAGTAAGLAGAGAAGAAVAGDDRDDQLADRDAEGRDEVADRPEVGDRTAGDQDPAYGAGDGTVPRRAQPDDVGTGDDDPGRRGAGADDAGQGEREDVQPGERTTRLRRYVVTERVVQTVEELPDDRS